MRTLLSSLLLLSFVSACRPAEPEPTPKVDPPAAPSMLAATPGPAFVRLVWRDEADSEDGFIIGRVELSSADAAFTAADLVEVARGVTDQVVYRDTTPMAGRFYAYGVAAFNAGGQSDFVLVGSAVSPFSNTAFGCQVATPSLEDPDGDGLPSTLEQTGWTVHVNVNGQMQFTDTMVASAVTSGDADDDHLCDAEERILRTNPNVADTDGDGLNDDVEVFQFASSPINVDSDGDATGNSAFFDGSELSRFGTSPTLADTDGDGRSDFQEINQNSTNALVADLPLPKLELVGTVDVSLDMELSNGTTQSNAVTRSLTRASETMSSQTNSTASTTTSEISVEASVSVSAGFPDGVSASASATYGQTDGYMSETSTSFDSSSSQSARDGYQEAVTQEATQNRSVNGGKVAVQLKISNAGTRTFELTGLVVSALKRDPQQPSRLGTIASLELPMTAQTINLGEGQSTGPLRVEASIPANVALDLLANPSGLTFRPATFQLVDRTGANFAFSIGESTANRTALLVIDYGGERALEQYHVATNVQRLEGGQVAGVKMKDALKAIGLTQGAGWDSEDRPGKQKKLTKVRDLAAQQKGQGTSKFWAVLAADNTSSRVPAAQRLVQTSADFDELVLMPRDRVYLAYVADEDGDGLFSREERLYRTSDQLTDTDGDGLSDLQEIREGWNVFSTLPSSFTRPHVFSDPTQPDADRDGLNDTVEKQKGTDPNRADTDGDGVNDNLDAEPLKGVNRPMLVGIGTLGLMQPVSVMVADDGSSVVLGTGGVDVDNDGVLTNGFNGSCFLMGFDVNGRRTWVNELELLPQNGGPGGLMRGSNGHVYYANNLDGTAFAGVPGGWRLVELDRTGAVVSNVGLPVSGFTPTTFLRNARGDFFMAGNAPFDGFGFPWKLVTFNAAGTQLATKTFAPPHFFSDPRLPRTDQVSFTNTGVYFFTFIAAGTCQLSGLDSTLTTALPNRDLCSDFPTPTLVTVTEANDAYVTAGPKTVKYDALGTVTWQHVSTSAGDSPTSLAVDPAGRAYRVVQDTGGGPITLKQIDALGGTGFEVALPTPSYFGTVTLDANGNSYLLGQTQDGLGGRVTQQGTADLVLVRNPQLLFGP